MSAPASPDNSDDDEVMAEGGGLPGHQPEDDHLKEDSLTEKIKKAEQELADTLKQVQEKEEEEQKYVIGSKSAVKSLALANRAEDRFLNFHCSEKLTPSAINNYFKAMDGFKRKTLALGDQYRQIVDRTLNNYIAMGKDHVRIMELEKRMADIEKKRHSKDDKKHKSKKQKVAKEEPAPKKEEVAAAILVATKTEDPIIPLSV